MWRFTVYPRRELVKEDCGIRTWRDKRNMPSGQMGLNQG